MARRGGTAIHTKKYERFRGVDFTTDPALIDAARSPWAPNIIADMGGMPEKRPGWRTVKEESGRVNGLYSAVFDGVRHLLAHTGTKLVRWYEGDTQTQEIAVGLPDARSIAVYMGGFLWIFTGKKLYRYNGTTAEPAENGAYIPTTVIARAPGGGGVTYESVNLLTGKQTVRFLADGTSTVYKLPYESITSVDKVEIDAEEITTGFTPDLTAGTVTFDAAPEAPIAGQEDNVYITFTRMNTQGGRINKCRTAIVWGINGSTDRIVAAGNEDYPNQDYICAYSDGGYWPDSAYAIVGTDETAIMGYRRLGETLAIIKEDNGQDSTVFIRTGELDSEGEARFPIKPCLSGAGGVSLYGFGNIGDEQLILTGAGVYALTTNSLTAERIVQNRSYRVDPKLTKEMLSEAVTVSWNGAYLIFIGGRVYGLDGKQQKSYPAKSDTSFLYECFYWENVPARCAMKTVNNGVEALYFGTEEGKICKFNTDIADLSRFSDDGEPITAIWSTPADDDGDPMILKTLLKKGNAVTIKPYTRSSAKVSFRTDKDAADWHVAQGTMDIFDWEDIDFERFTFNANDAPSEIPFNRKVKNYKRLQIIVKNDAVNEGFGVFAITKHYVTGNFAKR